MSLYVIHYKMVQQQESLRDTMLSELPLLEVKSGRDG